MRRTRSHSWPRQGHWLCIAYAFPPINRSSTHRTLAFVKHLDRLGWDATVLTAEPDGEPVDASLLQQIPASANVLRVPSVDVIARIKRVCDPGGGHRGEAEPTTAGGPRHQPHDPRRWSRATKLGNLREWMSRWLVTPDSRIGWIAPAVRSGLLAVRRHRPDVVYSTSPYMSAHLIAMILSRWAHLPWVADFRDPWRGNPFRDLGSSSVERWDDFLEWSVVKSASHVVCNTPAMMEELRRRRPFVKGKSTTILNGFDPELLEGINPKRVAPAHEFVLAHTGQFYGPRSPVVWFRAFRRALDQTPEPVAGVHMLLVGPEQFEKRHLRDWAREAGVERNVHVLGRKSHAEALSYLAGSDALMLAGSAGEGGHLQTPNKLFEYLAIRKPIIATCPAASPIAEILRQARAAALTCDPSDDAALADAITRVATHRDTGPDADWGGLSRFDRVHRAKELAAVFDDVLRAHGSETARMLTSATT